MDVDISLRLRRIVEIGGMSEMLAALGDQAVTETTPAEPPIGAGDQHQVLGAFGQIDDASGEAERF